MLPCSALPRTLNTILLVMAWLALPAWVFVAAGTASHFLDDDSTNLATTFAAMCTFALFAAFFAGRVDKFAIKPAQEREEALITAVEQLSGMPTRPRRSVRAVR